MLFSLLNLTKNECFLQIKKQHIKLVLFTILVGKIKNNFAVARSFSEGLIHFLQITQKYYSITYHYVITGSVLVSVGNIFIIIFCTYFQIVSTKKLSRFSRSRDISKHLFLQKSSRDSRVLAIF